MAAEKHSHDGRHRWRRRGRRTSVVFAVCAVVLMIVLGFGVAAQVRDRGTADALDSARPADLLVVLDNVGRREAALRQEISQLQSSLDNLRRTDGGSEAALADAQARLDALSIEVGTVAARGPGIVVTVDASGGPTDPGTGIGSDVLLDAVQELRAAGAEAIQIAGGDGTVMRVGVDTWIAGSAGSVVMDGREMTAPYEYTAIGDPGTLAAALDIPGGVVDSIARAGGRCEISRSDEVVVSALRELRPRQYAQPGN